MNGLDKIIDEIALEAKGEADGIIGAAKEAAKRVTDRAKAEAERIEADAADRAELEYKRVIARAISAGEVTKKRVLLREKQRLIGEILKEAHIKTVGMSDAEYFEFMEKLLDKYASGKNGEIILSARDKERLSGGFKAAAERKGLKISEKSRDIDGGFILSYGDIEENCSVAALMESELDRLHDMVNGFLFG